MKKPRDSVNRWCHSDANGVTHSFADEVTEDCPKWCAVHQWAYDRECLRCLSPMDQMELFR